jgi:polyribonucleotide nucleotidyltransferase
MSGNFLNDVSGQPIRPIGRPETSVRNYHHSLCNNPEGHGSHLFRGGNLKSRDFLKVHNSISCDFFAIITNFLAQKNQMLSLKVLIWLRTLPPIG